MALQAAAGFLTLMALVTSRVAGAGLRMNMLQMLHSHNSYHTCPLQGMQDLFNSDTGQFVRDRLGGSLNPVQWYYDKPSVADQINIYGVRSFEFDIAYDDAGGRYRYRAGPKLAAAFADADSSAQDGGPDFDPLGWKVFHVPDFDFQSSCNTLAQCLAPLAEYHANHPRHTPIFVTLEYKSWNPRNLVSKFILGVVNALLKLPPDSPTSLTSTPDPDPSHLPVLEQTILSVFNRSDIFTPDDFRGSYPSLQERIAAIGWPNITEVRGKIIFKTTGNEQYLALQDQTWPGSYGGILFKEAYQPGPDPPDNHTVFASNDLSLLAQIGSPLAANLADTSVLPQLPDVVDAYRQAVANMVSGGKVMVRVTADMPVAEATDDFVGFGNAALAGGAHFVQTDTPGGWTSSCGGVASSYTVHLVQILRDSWDNATSAAVNTTAWNATAPVNTLASACNPVTAFTSCVRWTDKGLIRPPDWCSCYSRF